MSPVTALLRECEAACVSPGSLHGHCWPEPLHQHCPSPDRSQWTPDVPHLGLYLPTVPLVTTSGHGMFSLSLMSCPLEGHFLQMPPHHAGKNTGVGCHFSLDAYYSLYQLCRKDLNMFLQLKQDVFYLFDHCFCSTVFSGGFLFYVNCIFSISVP